MTSLFLPFGGMPSLSFDPDGGVESETYECPGAAVTAPGVADPEEVDVIDNTPPVHVLRSPCPRCTSDRGVIKPSGGQQCVYCIDCAKFLYNAPKSETGLPQRSVSTRPLLKPSQRARIIDRDNGHCVACGQTEGFMQVGHLLSVEDGRKIGATDAELWHDENLAVMCEECNLGFGRRTVSLRLVYRILKTRTTPA